VAIMTGSMRALRQPPVLTVEGLRELAWQEYREWRARIGRAPDTAQVMDILACLERLSAIVVSTDILELCNRVSELERHVAMLRQVSANEGRRGERHERA
jgi:hypothetical protein